MTAQRPPTGYPVLDAPSRTNGTANWHNLSTLTLGQKAMVNFQRVVSVEPYMWWYGVNRALYRFLQPSRDWFAPDRFAAIPWYINATDLLVSGRTNTFGASIPQIYANLPKEPDTLVGYMWESTNPNHAQLFPWLACVWWLVAVGGGLWLAARENERTGFWLVCTGSIAYITLVGSVCELGENARFSAYLLPFYTVVAGKLLSCAYKNCPHSFKLLA